MGSPGPVGRRAFLAAAAAVVMAACGYGPRPIAYGVAECDYCRMRIGDRRFGAEVITRAGKVLQFDSAECAARYCASLPDPQSVRGVWVADFLRPGTLVPATEARFGHLAGRASPMGGGLFAVAAGSVPARGTGALAAPVGWTEVVALARGSTTGTGTLRSGNDTARTCLDPLGGLISCDVLP